MSINPVLPQPVHTEQPADPRLQVNEGNGLKSTTAKVVMVVASAAAIIASFTYIGILPGIITTLACGTVSYLLFSKKAHNHSPLRHAQHVDVVHVPLLQRFVSYLPSFRTWFPSGILRMEHVPVGQERGGNGRGGNVPGRGHGHGHPAHPPSGPQGHVVVGGDHFVPVPPYGYGIPPVPPPSGSRGHVVVNGGHGTGAPVLPPGHGGLPPSGNVPVGRGHRH